MYFDEINKQRLNSLNKKLTDAETEFKNILDYNNIEYLIEPSFVGFVNENGNEYRYDFLILKHKENMLLQICIVEIDGSGHRLRANWKEIDKIKEDYLKENNINFVRFNHMELVLNHKLLCDWSKDMFDREIFYNIREIQNFIKFKE